MLTRCREPHQAQGSISGSVLPGFCPFCLFATCLPCCSTKPTLPKKESAQAFVFHADFSSYPSLWEAPSLRPSGSAVD